MNEMSLIIIITLYILLLAVVPYNDRSSGQVVIKSVFSAVSKTKSPLLDICGFYSDLHKSFCHIYLSK